MKKLKAMFTPKKKLEVDATPAEMDWNEIMKLARDRSQFVDEDDEEGNEPMTAEELDLFFPKDVDWNEVVNKPLPSSTPGDLEMEKDTLKKIR